MKILLTGANGFLGKHILDYLIKNQKSVLKIGKSFKNDIICDLAVKKPNIQDYNVSSVIHVAGKAHSIPKNKKEENFFYDVNVTGTKNLLLSLDNLYTKPTNFIFISSVSVYGITKGVLVNEKAPLNATDAYGKSKIIAEAIIQEWCKKNNVRCTILRLPLIIGKNPIGNLKTMIDGIKKGYYVNIDGGKAQKSMVLAVDVAKFIFDIIVSDNVNGIYNLTDGQHPNFFNFSKQIAIKLGIRQPYNIPNYFAFILAKIGDIFGDILPLNSDKFLKITSDLTFDDSKARKLANWNSTPVLEGFNAL